MNMHQFPGGCFIGIAVRTTNENGQAAIDIPALWKRFMTERIQDAIPNKTDHKLYCIYTDYEKDHTRPYTTILGCRVPHLNNIPAGMEGKQLNDTNYRLFTAAGNLMQGAVFNEWTKIWGAGLARTFTADIEVYDERSADPENAIVDIFIAVQ